MYFDSTDTLQDDKKFRSTESPFDILLFKTNIKFKKDLKKIENILTSNDLIIRWTIDRDDIDCVLRIESTHLDPHFIISQLKESGYCCEELTW